MKVNEKAAILMFSWLMKKYGIDNALEATKELVFQLRTSRYAVVKMSIGDRSDEVNARFSKLPTDNGITGHGVRIWINK